MIYDTQKAKRVRQSQFSVSSHFSSESDTMIFELISPEIMEPIDRCLANLQRLVIVVLDADARIADGNAGLCDRIGAPAIPAGIALREYLTEESGARFAFPRDGEPGEIRLTFRKGRRGESVLQCHLFPADDMWILIGEPETAEAPPETSGRDELRHRVAELEDQLRQKDLALEKINAAVTRLGRLDALTQLPNRPYFEQLFRKTLAAARRHAFPVALIMTDIDRLRRINELAGNETGDRVLQAFGALLKFSLREEDVCARYGGEEFVILLPHIDTASALNVAERIRERFQTQSMEGLPQPASASFGIAGWRGEEPGEKLIRRADSALQQAKESGRNCCVADNKT
jgi:diguanylate cyclase (GGDEF)-like protein